MWLILLKYWKAIVIAGVAITVITGSFGSGYRYRGLIETERQAKLKEEYDDYINKQNEVNRNLSTQLEDALKKLKQNQRVVTKYVRVEVEKPVYRDCVVPSSGVQLLNETADKLNGTREETNPR